MTGHKFIEPSRRRQSDTQWSEERARIDEQLDGGDITAKQHRRLLRTLRRRRAVERINNPWPYVLWMKPDKRDNGRDR